MKALSAALLVMTMSGLQQSVVMVANALSPRDITTISRRNLLLRGSAAVAAASGVLGKAQPAAAATTTTEEQDVYFGVGCYWHIQHEFVEAERSILNRGDSQLTSKTGYAGGNAVGKDGKVCYHNLQSMADYGRLGHGEVVGMTIPADQVVPFTKVYFSLFNPRTKDRVDPADRGGEYRSLLGIPGGTGHPSYPAMEAAAQEAGFKLVPGKGNDPDTLGKQIVFVHDTAKFPFYQAEVYHQYHNDFQSPPYGKAYNNLAIKAFEEGRLQSTGCPDKV
eukprot:CAMPEP_0198136680 /NCGR_PEP_ID=MMETSP1443-20131203/304_1 /TAXON_ID=186043 /ORGANISM="Entomoneis sp., Strain CCMP2396" /LENGTH=276 /DNA_ID=CAMNT_0043797937 /DNA_START=85 /DNA_END=915 /DNA_ORIENTATION=-